MTAKTLHEMDDMIKELELLEARYKTIKDEANAAAERCDIQRAALIKELTEQGVSSFKGTIGSVSLVNKFQVKFPNDPEKKAALKEYLLTADAFEDMWSINYQKLNSWYNEESARLAADGEVPDVPGLAATHEVTLSFRRSAK